LGRSLRDEGLQAQIDTILGAQPCVEYDDSDCAITVEPDSIDPGTEDRLDDEHARRLEGRLIDYRDVTFVTDDGRVAVQLCIGSPSSRDSGVVQDFVYSTLRPSFADLSFPTVADFVLAFTSWNNWLGKLNGCYRVSVESASATLRLPT
jgi:hypothetical protein